MNKKTIIVGVICIILAAGAGIFVRMNLNKKGDSEVTATYSPEYSESPEIPADAQVITDSLYYKKIGYLDAINHGYTYQNYYTDGMSYNLDEEAIAELDTTGSVVDENFPYPLFSGYIYQNDKAISDGYEMELYDFRNDVETYVVHDYFLSYHDFVTVTNTDQGYVVEPITAENEFNKNRNVADFGVHYVQLENKEGYDNPELDKINELIRNACFQELDKRINLGEYGSYYVNNDSESVNFGIRSDAFISYMNDDIISIVINNNDFVQEYIAACNSVIIDLHTGEVLGLSDLVTDGIITKDSFIDRSSYMYEGMISKSGFTNKIFEQYLNGTLEDKMFFFIEPGYFQMGLNFGKDETTYDIAFMGWISVPYSYNPTWPLFSNYYVKEGDYE